MIVPLIEWLPSLEETDQVWLSSVIFNLCTTNLQRYSFILFST